MKRKLIAIVLASVLFMGWLAWLQHWVVDWRESKIGFIQLGGLEG